MYFLLCLPPFCLPASPLPPFQTQVFMIVKCRARALQKRASDALGVEVQVVGYGCRELRLWKDGAFVPLAPEQSLQPLWPLSPEKLLL